MCRTRCQSWQLQSPSVYGQGAQQITAAQVKFVVERIRYSVSGSYGKWALELDAKAVRPPLKGMTISVEIQLPDSDGPPSLLSRRWPAVPDSIEGYCELIRLNSPMHPDCFSVILFCEAKALDALHKTLSLVGGHGFSAVLTLTLDAPGNKSPDLWASGWETETLRVVSWRMDAAVGTGQPA